LMHNEKVQQSVIGESCDVSTAALRDAYHEIANHEGIDLKRTRRGRRNDQDSWRPSFRELLPFGESDD